METIESLVSPHNTGDSDPEWEKPDDDIALARATLAHNVAAHDDEAANSTLSSFTTVDLDSTSLDMRIQEMNAAMARLMNKGVEKVEVKEEVVSEEAMDLDPPAAPGDFVPEVPTTGDFVPEGGTSDVAMGSADSARARPYSSLPAGTLEEKVFKIEGFPDDFPGIGKRSAEMAQQLTKEEIASLFSQLKTETWTRPAVERVLEVYQIYKRQVAQQKMLAAPFNRARRGVVGQLDPGSTGATLMCPSCFADWQRQDNKVEGKCKLCQKFVIAVDKGPPSAEIKLGSSSWWMYCGSQGVSWHTDADEAQREAASVDIGSWAQPPPKPTDQKELSFADQVPMALRLSLAHTVASQPFDEVQFAEQGVGSRPHLQEDWQASQETRAFHPQLAAALDIQKKSAGPVAKEPRKPTEEEFLERVNPQLDVMVEMQAGAQSVDEPKGAAILRHLDTEKLHSLLKRNYLQGPGNQGEEFSQRRLPSRRPRRAARSQILRPQVDSIDTWGPQLRAALEMNVFNPEAPLKEMELDDIETTKSCPLWLLFSERVTVSRGSLAGDCLPQTPLALRSSLLKLFCVAVGSVEFQILRLKRIIELHMGEQRMIGGKWKKMRGPLDAPSWAKPLPEAEKLMLEMRTHPSSFRQPFFEPIALTMEEIEAQVAMGTRPALSDIMGPFHAKGEDGTHADVGSGKPLLLLWPHLHSQEAKNFIMLNDLPPPTTDLEWKQLYREMGSFFAAKVFISRTPQVVLDLPVADIHDSREHLRLRAVCDERITLPLKAFRDFPEVYNSLSTSLGQEAVVEVKMAWRCNTEQRWTARLKPEYAGPIYRKLGHAESYIQGLGLGDLDTAAAFGAERIPLHHGSDQEHALPPITPDNVSSVASDDYKKKNAGDKTAHVFWARMECASRFLLITGEHRGKAAQIQLILDELRFSKTNLMGHVSDLIWSVVLCNPEKDGVKKIHEMAASGVRPA
ncbi:cpt [Symbiodinium sp. CCMP2592]|nr:cpt [Symbiodinium sp. CCMP2592]